MIHSLAEFFREGGPFMLVNLVASAVAIAIVAERGYALSAKLNVNARAFMGEVQKLLLAGDVEKALKLCDAAPGRALPRVLRAGLESANRGEVEVARALEEAVLEVTPLVTKRVASLWSLANIATLLGLVGTVAGLIGTFKSLGAASPEMKQIMLSRGISEAMNNTAFGLGIAVSCIIAHLLLHSKAKAMVEEIETCALKLENALARQRAGVPNPLDRAA
jgi:biopolymer transport protein ExbB/TolQ